MANTRREVPFCQQDGGGRGPGFRSPMGSHRVGRGVCRGRGGLPAPRAHRVTCWNKLWGKEHSLVPWLLDANVHAQKRR